MEVIANWIGLQCVNKLESFDKNREFSDVRHIWDRQQTVFLNMAHESRTTKLLIIWNFQENKKIVGVRHIGVDSKLFPLI